MNRIDQKFKTLKAGGRKAFIAFLTAGFPSLKVTKDLVLSLESAGVDLIELGVPFSDPLADGPTVQAASYQALKGGVTLRKIITTVAEIRRHSQIPIALMTYFNPVMHFGTRDFMEAAQRAGVDGLIIPDLPPEEAAEVMAFARKRNISVVFFLAPTTTKARMKKIVRSATGFIYYVSLTGVTGARQSLPKDLTENVRKAKKMTGKPVCVGFGVSTPAQVRAILRVADGVIVGSAIIKQIEKKLGRKDLVPAVTKFVRQLASGKE